MESDSRQRKISQLQNRRQKETKANRDGQISSTAMTLTANTITELARRTTKPGAQTPETPEWPSQSRYQDRILVRVDHQEHRTPIMAKPVSLPWPSHHLAMITALTKSNLMQSIVEPHGGGRNCQQTYPQKIVFPMKTQVSTSGIGKELPKKPWIIAASAQRKNQSSRQ